MINELIEKEIEKIYPQLKDWLESLCQYEGARKAIGLGCLEWHEEFFRKSLQTIAKEVAMRFKEKNYGSYYINKDKIELFVDQIISEVSK